MLRVFTAYALMHPSLMHFMDHLPKYAEVARGLAALKPLLVVIGASGDVDGME